MKVKSDIYHEEHFLVNAFCDVGCGEEWDSFKISPTQWAYEHTKRTGHVTSIWHEKTWRELVTEVTDED